MSRLPVAVFGRARHDAKRALAGFDEVDHAFMIDYGHLIHGRFAVPSRSFRLHVFLLSSEPVSSGQVKTRLTVDNEVITICNVLPLPANSLIGGYNYRLHEAFCPLSRSEVNVAAVLWTTIAMCGFHVFRSQRTSTDYTQPSTLLDLCDSPAGYSSKLIEQETSELPQIATVFEEVSD